MVEGLYYDYVIWFIADTQPIVFLNGQDELHGFGLIFMLED